jgi:hypothetical protein
VAVAWTLEPHCCLTCLGRVVSQAIVGPTGIGGPLRLYRCSCCGTEAVGGSAAVICACGFRFNGRHHLAIRCQANPNKTPESSAEFVALQV